MPYGSRLSLQSVAKTYSEQSVLSNVNLEVQSGEFVAIVGRSGCGKSTLLRLVAGLDKATSGLVKLDGHPVHGVHPEVHVLFQDARLLPWRTAIGNVELGLPRRERPSAWEALRQVGLIEKKSAWPHHLSGGQRQRVALARALSRTPRLMLLDEPFSALDALTRMEMQSLLETLWKQHQFSVLLVTHDIDEAVKLADRVVLMEDGEVVMDVSIHLPRPREIGTEFARLERHILGRVVASTIG